MKGAAASVRRLCAADENENENERSARSRLVWKREPESISQENNASPW